MNLLIDIGNSLTKVAISNKKKIIKELKFKKFEVSDLINIISEYNITFSALSNVSKPANSLVKTLKEKTVFFSFNKKIKLPFILNHEINEVGHDRLALICAAKVDFPYDNVLVIDLGTCITYDIKSNDNIYNPGGISPGINMRIKSISNNAFNLFDTNLNYPKKLIADNTKTSLDIGVIGGVKFEIEGFIKQYQGLFDNLIVVITGGDSKFLSGKIKNTIFTNSNYIFKGLDYLIEYNK